MRCRILPLAAIVLAPAIGTGQVNVPEATGKCSTEWCPAHKQFESCGSQDAHCEPGTVTGTDLRNPETWTCTPRASSGAAVPSTDATARALTQLVLYGKIDAATGMQAASDIGTAVGTAIGTSIRQSMEESAARAQLERMRAEQLALQVARLEEQRKQRAHENTMAEMRSIGGELEPLHMRASAPFDGGRVIEDPGAVQLRSVDETPMALRPVTAPGGGPIYPCSEWREAAPRLRAGLKPLVDAQYRSLDQMNEATRDKAKADAEFSRARREAATTIATQAYERWGRVAARIRHAYGREASERYRRLETLVQEANADIEEVRAAAEALANPQPAPNDRERALRYLQLTFEAGTSLENLLAWAENEDTQAHAEELAAFVPAAEIALDLGKSGIDMSVSLASSKMSEEERKKANDSFMQLYTRTRDYDLRARQMESDLKLYCPK